ncbi:MAG: HIG1 domain-containing protein [Rhodospirillales bacterium]|jgi:uncharacterized membrane protein YqgA involved in biofilm formation|nr:HIG1 domain-containing protein [Rhodospirillales bacterium]
MSSVLPFLMIAAMAATALVLLAGVVGFAFSTKVNEKYSTKLMATRVLLQGVAILLFGLMVLLQGA